MSRSARRLARDAEDVASAARIAKAVQNVQDTADHVPEPFRSLAPALILTLCSPFAPDASMRRRLNGAAAILVAKYVNLKKVTGV